MPVTWLVNATFTDGSTATGSFVYDADNGPNGTYSNVSITLTGGSTFPTTVFTVPVASSDTQLDAVTNNSNLNGTPVFVGEFSAPLTDAGGTIAFSSFAVSTCVGPTCGAATGPIALGESGSVTSVAASDAFQVRYVANFFKHGSSSFIDIVNTGSSATAAAGFITGGNLCVQVYAFDNNEELLACCTCTITPNGLASIEVDGTATGLYSINETGTLPSSGVIKLVATSGALGCSASTANPLAPGMAAWATTQHDVEIPAGTTTTNYQLSETPFTQSVLSAGEYSHLTTFCSFDIANGTDQGVCPGCKLTGLGASSSK